jgi:hypothetical protein
MLLNLALQEALGDSGLGGKAGRGQLVEIAMLGPAFAEVSGLDPSALDEGSEAVIGLAEADAELARKRALAEIRLGFQRAEDGQAGLEVQIWAQGSGLRAQGSGLRAQGSGLRAERPGLGSGSGMTLRGGSRT